MRSWKGRICSTDGPDSAARSPARTLFRKTGIDWNDLGRLHGARKLPDRGRGPAVSVRYPAVSVPPLSRFTSHDSRFTVHGSRVVFGAVLAPAVVAGCSLSPTIADHEW